MKKTILLMLVLLSVFGIRAGAQQIQSQWNGARVAFLGDSITDARQIGTTNDVYWNIMSDLLGTVPYVYGISGHRMNQIIGQGEKLEAEHGQEVDAIFVFVGTNDYNGNIPLGEWFIYTMQKTDEDGPITVDRLHREPNYDDATFCGRTNATLLWLKTHYPTKQIILLTPLHRGFAKFSERNIQPDESFANACGYFIDDYVKAVKEAGDIWAVPVIDIFSLSGLYPLIDGQASYFRNTETDRLHPNTDGHQRLAKVLSYALQFYPAKLD